MRISTYVADGRETYGVVVGEGIVDVGRRLGARHPDLRSVLAAGALDEVAEAADGAAADIGLDRIRFRPVLPNPGKIFMVGVNYHSHRTEMARDTVGNPTIFVRFPESQVGHLEPMLVPRESQMLDYEGELAVIIGTAGRRISKADSLGHIAGYACYNDGSVRDWQRHTSQWIPGKNFVGTGPFGPWMVTADEIPDPSKLHLQTRLNDEVMQDSTTDLLIFDIPTLIHYISSFIPLDPGDLIVSGTPGGVGVARDPQVFMKPGDVVEVEISGVGVLKNTIQAED